MKPLKRYDIRWIFSDPQRRRLMIARSTVVTQAREGIVITLEDALASYDQLESSGELDRIRKLASQWK